MRRTLNWLNPRPTGSPELAEPSAVATTGGGPGNNNCYRAPHSSSCQDRCSPAAHSPPSSLRHSSSSRSPSLTPQPATPSSPIFGRSNLSKLVASNLPIDDLATPDWDPAGTSESPIARNQSSSALIFEDDFNLFADPNPKKRGCFSPSAHPFGTIVFEPTDSDVEMTTGPNFDSAMGRSRQDSFVSAGAKPISVANPNPNRGRRESLAGSMMGGMSWGGISVGSFLKEETMLIGTSPYPTQQSPSYHSSSYIPKLEANFMRDFTCCDRTWSTLHDLLQHYEEHHHANATPATRNLDAFGANQGNGRGSISRATPSAPAAGRSQQAQPMQGYQQPRAAGTIGAGIGMGGIGQMMRQQHQQAPASTQKSNLMSHMNDDMDTVADMELDDPMDMDDSQRTIQQTRQLFGQRPQLHLTSAGLPRQALRSQPTTPAAANFGFQNNPTVSSVNTPTLTTQQGIPQRGQFSQENDDEDDIPGMPMKMNLGNLNLNTGLNFGALGTIDDPAKRLYSPGGTAQMTSQQRAFDQQMQMQQQLQQQLSAMNLDLSQLPAGTDPSLILQQMTAMLMPPNEEPKPFRCPVIGCEKAYKNQNGLKYHKTHGHSTQQLHENGDGTFSIVNPETSAPYPGTMGMEKEKPFKCDVCGKRYKNLNGLKYHKQHSPMCDPEMRAQHQTLLTTMMTNPTALLALQQGLPNINEEYQ
ncbi:hypothetical protein B0T16DRAFT_319578 [Cercophora newfieldiana]|uniref:C2H2-type domain-containing protein n=1 Tax=Cercophora newfieldiana TaxID=92897 RepID=A0AA39YRX7_9PEZI|nr:hypothetical protein B0T16DRAFT_319578 [Cercophora newfieldiana]